MLPELPSKEIEIDGVLYKSFKLPLGDAKEVLLRLLGVAGDELETFNPGAILGKMTMRDLNFLQEKLLGKNCSFQNDQEHWVPLSKEIVDNHFAGRPGKYFSLLIRCLQNNYSDFLSDLDLAALGLQIAKADASPE